MLLFGRKTGEGAQMGEPITIPRVCIAGIGSNSGKTTVAVGLVRALSQRGLKVQSFKCGSDFIDAAYLSRASGRSCRMLDTWVLGSDGVTATFADGTADADVAVIEGVGGVFDGHGMRAEPLDGRQFHGSTADVAA